MNTVTYATREWLCYFAQKGPSWGFNRQLDLKAVRILPDDVKFPLVFSMIHEHKRGVRVDPHMRCVFQVREGGPLAMVDIPNSEFSKLPSEVVEIPEKEEVAQSQ